MSGPLSNPYMFKSAATAAGFYTHSIANSIKVVNSSANSTATKYLYRDGGAGNRDTWTIGMWIKRVRIATSSAHTSMAAWGGHSGSGSARGYGDGAYDETRFYLRDLSEIYIVKWSNVFR